MDRRPTLVQKFERAARGELGVRFLDRRERATYLTYAELLRRARRVAGGLVRLGLAPGDRVGLVLPTGPEFYDAFFGVMLAGAVPVPVYPPVRLGRLEEYHQRTSAMLRSVGARLLLTDARVRRILGQTADRARPPLGTRTVAEVPRGDGPLPLVRADDVAMIQLSSGTTVAPKPIPLTHGQVLANVECILGAIMEAHPEGPSFKHAGVCWLPLYHDMGLVGCVMTALAHPGELTLIPPELFVARPAVWLRAISRYGGTISPAPNFAYGLCADRVRDEELAELDLSSWRVALNGAEPVTPTVLQRFVQRFSGCGLRPEALTPVYGLAEASLAVTFSALDRPFTWRAFHRGELSREGLARPADDGHPLVSLGRPLPGFSLSVVDRQGQQCAPDQLGRVLVRGPSVMDGYHQQPELSADVLQGGWLDTGDLGFLHLGELYLYGRAKEIIILRGRNLAPQEIEQALDALPDVRTGCSAAVGVVQPDGDGEELVVLVERARDTAMDADELERLVHQRITRQTGLAAARVVVLEPGTLPRTSSGKIRRGEAARQLAEGTLSPPKPVTPLRLVGAMIGSSLALGRSKRTAL